MAEVAIAVENLLKDFPVGLRGKQVRALDGLSLSVEAGQIYGLLGPNGSGKSTTIKILLGLLKPSRGAAYIFGMGAGSLGARQRLGYLPEAPHFYGFLTGRELLNYYARISCVAKGSREALISDALKLVGMESVAGRCLRTYSKGMLQRIGLAQALLQDPKLLILDEPTAGVDPEGTAAIGSILRKLKARGKTILLSSHLLGQMEGLCDRVAILNKGRLLCEGSVDDLLKREDTEAYVAEGLDARGRAAVEAAIKAAGGNLCGVEPARRSLDALFSSTIKDEMEAM